MKALRAAIAVVLVTVLAIAAVAPLLPTRTKAASNIDDLEWRPLTTTTTAPVATATDHLILVDGQTVYRIPRTPATARTLWLVTQLDGVTTR